MQFLHGQKYFWKLPPFDKKKIFSIASSYNLSVPIAHTLFSRGYVDNKLIDAFLFSSFEKDVSDGAQLKDAQKAVDRLLRAIKNKEKILIVGDYDVDGITSCALMLICLLPLHANINFFIPNRVKDGYGLATKVVERAAQNGYSVIITVDNGITAFEPALKAKELGIDLIITDHHRPHDHIPDAFAIINPNQADCEYPFKLFAGVGVIFKVMSLLYKQLHKEMPAKAYELLLLGTIADVVPLLGENRFWVRHGLNYINKIQSKSFLALKKNGKIQKPYIDSTDIGFNITPQINALGRLQDSRQAVGFLIGSDSALVQEVAKVLFELNQARKEIEKDILAQVVAQVEQKKIDVEKENIIIAASTSWSPGVIGLVASRLVSLYGKPVILLHLTKKGIAKGSCRSIAEFNMFDALNANSDLLHQFGGHSQAAGLSLPIDNIPKLKEKLETLIAQQLSPFDLKQKIVLDAQIKLQDVNNKFFDDLNHLQPFGHGNHQPLFHLDDVVLIQPPQLLKDAHVKCSVFADGIIKPLIFFNRPEVFDLLLAQKQEPFRIATTVGQNYWNGKTTTQLYGTDIAISKEISDDNND